METLTGCTSLGVTKKYEVKKTGQYSFVLSASFAPTRRGLCG